MEVNKIYNECCLDTMGKMEDNFVNLTVTSPPYNFNAGSGLGTKYLNSFKDNLSQDGYYEWSEKILLELMRVSVLVSYNIQMIAGNKDAFLRLIGRFYKEIREIIIWDKQYSEPAINEKVLNSEFEFILLMDKNGGGRKIDCAEFDRGTVANVLRENKAKNSIKARNGQEQHLAVFPQKIPDKLINWFSKEGDIIYDPFMGTGTTAISAVKYKRNYIGSELSETYCKTIDNRVSPYLAQTTLF